MSECCRLDSKVVQAWDDFINTGSHISTLEEHSLSEEVLDSWSRCYEFHVDPFDDSRHPSMNVEDFQLDLKRKEKLIHAAVPFMTHLYKFVKGTGFVVVLANENGYILELYADQDVWKNPITHNFFLGASWQESVAGTNAIGTAMVIKEAVQISGAEHYCKKHHCLTCSAAPIFDLDGELLGILDISGNCEDSHVHTLGMVVATAEAIMAQLRIENQNNQLSLANQKLVNFFNMVSDGILILDSKGQITELNPAAEAIFNMDQSQIIGKEIKQLIPGQGNTKSDEFDYTKAFTYKEATIQAMTGPIQIVASSEPFFNERDQFSGSFITLKPIKQVQKLVSRFGGYMASLQFSDIIGNSNAIREAVRLANLTAFHNSNVLLMGESGTGKEIFAQAIHNKSSQSNAPFVALNCGAIPRELIGSELFGYEEGAFTGAKRGGRPGKFEMAYGGTLFLDEIGDMPLEHQTVLLRVIQEKRLVRIGGEKLIPVNVRLICATNKDLTEEVEKGTFRRDLFYRLNVMSILIPPLRSRMEDVPHLFRYFLNKLCSDRGREVLVDAQVFDLILSYPWPGNVRELQNVVERAVNLAESDLILPQHLPSHIQSQPQIYAPLEEVYLDNLAACRNQKQKLSQEGEKIKLIELLNKHSGNVTRVAQEMGISRKTVYCKMKTYEVFNTH